MKILLKIILTNFLYYSLMLPGELAIVEPRGD